MGKFIAAGVKRSDSSPPRKMMHFSKTLLGAEMGNIHQKKYIIYNIQILTDFCSKYTIYIYFENFGKYTIYNILLPQKVYLIYFQNIL